MNISPPNEAGARSRQAASRRWWVHLGLLITVVVSLLFEGFVLTIHIVIGLMFVAFTVVHLGQRRRVSTKLASKLLCVRGLHRRAGRLALADAFLAAVTVAMLVSGFWDWFSGHPTRIRWHAFTGVALAVLVLLHTIRRRRRLRRSQVR